MSNSYEGYPEEHTLSTLELQRPLSADVAAAVIKLAQKTVAEEVSPAQALNRSFNPQVED